LIAPAQSARATGAGDIFALMSPHCSMPIFLAGPGEKDLNAFTRISKAIGKKIAR